MSSTQIASLLPLFMAVPLAGAALGVVLPRVLRIALSFLIPTAGLVAGLALLVYHTSHPAIAENVGGYIPGVAIPFASDAFSSLMIVATSVVALASLWFSLVVGEMHARFFPPLTSMLMAGVYGALSTADLFNMFVCIEVMLLPSYALLAMTGTLQRLRAGRLFVLINLVTSAVLVIGVTVVYATAGTANIAALAGAAHGNGPVVVAASLVLIALSIKAGLFPVHTWLPRTYPFTSPAVMSLFSGLHTKVAFAVIVRIYTVVFGLDTRWTWLIVVICCAAMIVGGWAGIAERTIRGVLAYQMVNGMPFLLVGLAFAGFGNPVPALAAGVFYALHHMATVASLALSSGAIEETYGTGRMQRLSGIMRSDPLVAAIFAAGALSIVGFPPFSGVVAKVGVVLAVANPTHTGAHAATWPAVIVLVSIVIAGMGALICMLRVWREVFWGRPMNPRFVDPNLAVPVKFMLPSLVMIILSLGMFIGAGPVYSAATRAATAVSDVSAYQHAVLGEDPANAVGVAPTGGAGIAGQDTPDVATESTGGAH